MEVILYMNKVKFTATYNADVLRDIVGNKGPKMKHVAAAMLYNIVVSYSDKSKNNGWVRFSKNRWTRMTGLPHPTLVQATQILVDRGLIEHKCDALDKEEELKFGKGNLFRPHKPVFGAMNEVGDD